MSLSFKEHLLLEQVRAMEAHGDLDAPSLTYAPDLSFTQKLVARAKALVAPQLIQLDALEKLRWRFSLVLVVLAIVAGASAVVNAVASQSSTLNIYWLLLVLLGFHLFSVLLWVVLMAISGGKSPPQGVAVGIWQLVAPWLMRQHKANQVHAEQAWLNIQLQGKIGRWWFSMLTHGLWLVYLATGLVVLFAMLATHKYDFFWATTILSDEAFIRFTQWLAQPLDILGLSTPSFEQVQSSQLQAANAKLSTDVAAALRQSWAQFLLGSLLLYGVLPRTLLMIISRLMHRLAQKRFTPDFSQPYYYRLHQQLMPVSSQATVIDPDTHQPSTNVELADDDKSSPLPVDAIWAGLELSQSSYTLVNKSGCCQDLGVVNDADSLAGFIQALEANAKAQPVVIVVQGSRLPDRGTRRILSNVVEKVGSENCWLAVTLDATTQAEHWQEAAHACQIKLAQVVYVDASN